MFYSTLCLSTVKNSSVDESSLSFSRCMTVVVVVKFLLSRILPCSFASLLRLSQFDRRAPTWRVTNFCDCVLLVDPIHFSNGWQVQFVVIVHNWVSPSSGNSTDIENLIQMALFLKSACQYRSSSLLPPSRFCSSTGSRWELLVPLEPLRWFIAHTSSQLMWRLRTHVKFFHQHTFLLQLFLSHL